MPEASLQGPARPASSVSSSLITPETLSKVDWYSRRPPRARVPCYNSDADDGNHASEAEDTEHEGGSVGGGGGGDVKEGFRAARRGLKEGDGVLGERRQLPSALPSLPLAFAGEKLSVAASKDANKVERPPPHTYAGGAIPWSEVRKVERPPPHTYAGGAIPLSGNIPHSGILLPHHYKNKQHSGAHGTGAHAHKGLLPGRGISLIPSLVSCQSMKGRRALDGEIEPSSPKVTCLGRIKIKQKCQHEAGKVSEAAAAHRQLGKKGVRLGVAGTQDRDEGPVRSALSPPTPTKADLRKSIHWGHKKDTQTTDHTLDAEAKAKKSMRKALMESKYLSKFHRERDQCLLSDAPIEFTSSHAESAIDLGRFPSERSGQMRELTKASTSFLTVGDLDACGSGFVPQVPPANSLLLMRNSKSRAACMVLGSSSSRLEQGVTSTKMFDERGDLPTESEHHEQRAGFLGSDVNSLSAVELERVDHTLGREVDVVDHASFHSKADPEIRLWQRRCVVRPMELNVGRPIAYS